MSFIKNSFLIIILNLIAFYNFSFSQESYLIKKKITEDNSSAPDDNKNNTSSKEELKKKEKIKKEDRAKEVENIQREKNVLKSKDNTTNKIGDKIDKGSDNFLILKDNKLRIIYKPNQVSLSQEDVIKVIKISSNFN